jgi:hypothetical protein
MGKLFNTRSKRRFLVAVTVIALGLILNGFVVSKIFGGSGFWLSQPEQVGISDGAMKTIFAIEMLGATLSFAVLIAFLLFVTGDRVNKWVKAGE